MTHNENNETVDNAGSYTDAKGRRKTHRHTSADTTELGGGTP